MQVGIAISGAHSAENAGKTLVTRVESATSPNRVGAGQRRALTLSGDELIYTTPGSGGIAAAVTLRRATWGSSGRQRSSAQRLRDRGTADEGLRTDVAALRAALPGLVPRA